VQWFLCSAASDFLGRFGRLAHTVLVESLQASSAMCEAEEACCSALPQGRRLACRCLNALAFLGPSKASSQRKSRMLLTQPWAAPLCLHLVLATIVSGVVPSESHVCLSGGLHTQSVVGRLCKFPLSRDCLALSQGLSQFAQAHNLLFLIGCLSPLSRGSALIRHPLLQASSLLSLCVPQCSGSLFLLCALSRLFHLGWVLLIGGHQNSKIIDSLLL
jgi:hypothetical protein